MALIAEQEQAVQKLREEVRKRPLIPMRQMQAVPRDSPVRGGVWITKACFPAPKTSNVRDQLFDVIESMKSGEQVLPLRTSVEHSEVPFEWVGPRQSNAPQPDLPHSEVYERLCAEAETDTTIFYVHGGAF